MSSEHVPWNPKAPHPTQELLERLESLMAKATKGTWSWEDQPPTVYAGRVDPVGEFAGQPICGHGYNLFGRLNDLSHNGRADLDVAVASVNALPTMIAAIRELRAVLQYARNLIGPDEIIDKALCGEAGE